MSTHIRRRRQRDAIAASLMNRRLTFMCCPQRLKLDSSQFTARQKKNS
jgi:hypothetical protein